MRLFNAVTSLRDHLILMLGVFAAPRASEAFGLQRDCFKGDYIEIKNTAWEGNLYRGQVKNDSRFRRVGLGPRTRRILEEYLAETPDAPSNSLLFPGRGGSPLWPGTWLQNRIQPIAKSLGITAPVTFQVLRRTCVTRNQKHGSLKDIQAHAGHASIATTRNIYMQEIPESVMEMIRLDKMDVLGAVQ